MLTNVGAAGGTAWLTPEIERGDRGFVLSGFGLQALETEALIPARDWAA